MKTISTLLFLGALALATAAGADVTGKWTGSFKITRDSGETKDSTAVLNLKQAGTEITGSVGPTDEEQHTITKGKIDGNKITLESSDGGMVIQFDLLLTGERIAGDVAANGEGRSMKASIDVKRAK